MAGLTGLFILVSRFNVLAPLQETCRRHVQSSVPLSMKGDYDGEVTDA